MPAASWVHKEGRHASIPKHRCPPPRPTGRVVPLAPRRFWLTLTIESRARILGTLSRIVAQQLAGPPAVQEATHERN